MVLVSCLVLVLCELEAHFNKASLSGVSQWLLIQKLGRKEK